MLAAAALIAVLSGSWMWSQAPEYRTLYSNVSDRDGGAVVTSLAQMNIPYRFTEGSGAITVPASMVHDARLKLAAQGLPKGGGVGYELMENQKFGSTQFQEQVNFQRALEGELARTIQTLSAVQAARVHLAIPKAAVFLRESQRPSASVLLNLHPGRMLERAQISGIVHLVSSSVPDLGTAAVSVIDQHGALLSGNGDTKGASALDAGQLSYISQLETNYTRRIQDILEPIVGRANLRAQVTAEIDFSETESLAETFKPNGEQADAAVRSKQLSEEPRAGGSGTQGVPGALSNQPAPAPTAPLVASGANKGSAPLAADQGTTRRDSTTNYEVDKTVRRTRNATGTIKRLSAAVVVNYRRSAEATAVTADAAADAQKADPAKTDASKAEALKSKPAPLTPEEMQGITALVKETIGFTEKRGDSVNIVNVAFSVSDAPEAIAEVPMWQQPEMIALGKEVGRNALIGGLTLFLILGVLRPLLRQLASSPPRSPATDQEFLSADDDIPVTLANPLESARQLARQDPKAVANVVKNWVGSDG